MNNPTCTIMKKSLLKIALLSLLAVSIAGNPAAISAQTTNKPPTEKKEGTEKKARPIPFHGTLSAIDKGAKTISVGERVFQVTSETKIYKGEKAPATLDQGVVGAPVTGTYKKGETGKLMAYTIHFSSKTEEKTAEKSAEKTTEKP
jgi:hypothetical protein